MSRQAIRCGHFCYSLLIFIVAALPWPAHAALEERLGGLAYYDTVLDVTWLRDANLAVSEQFGLSLSSGYDPIGPDSIGNTGLMSWDTAQNWIAGMNAANYLGASNWRLPTMVDTGAPGCDWGFSGTDCGDNVQTYENGVVYSEMAYMFHANLGNLSMVDANGNFGPNRGLKNSGPFTNIDMQRFYWLGLEYSPDTSLAWAYHMGAGHQGNSFPSGLLKDSSSSVWAVRSGDISAVPLPPALWMFASAVMGLRLSVSRPGCAREQH